jgi:hypothetical protein
MWQISSHSPHCPDTDTISILQTTERTEQLIGTSPRGPAMFHFSRFSDRYVLHLPRPIFKGLVLLSIDWLATVRWEA